MFYSEIFMTLYQKFKNVAIYGGKLFLWLSCELFWHYCKSVYTGHALVFSRTDFVADCHWVGSAALGYR